jgi:mRNA interferase MazF
LIREALEAHLSRRERERAEAILVAAAKALAEDPTAREEALAVTADFLPVENQALARAEVGKVRPVVVIQADLLTAAGLATWLVVPLTSQRRQGAEALRVPIRARDRLGDGPLTALSAVEMAALEEARRGVMGF